MLRAVDPTMRLAGSPVPEGPPPAPGAMRLICRLDVDGRFSRIGAAGRLHLRQAPEALIGTPLADLWPAPDRMAIVAGLADLQPASPIMSCSLAAGPEQSRLEWTICGLFDDQGRLSAYQAIGCLGASGCLSAVAAVETALPAAVAALPCAAPPAARQHSGESGLCQPASVALRASEGRARRAETRLRAAVEGMGEAFVLWDADDRLVLCNRQFRALYPELAQRAMPGVRFATLAAVLARSGQVVEAGGRVDEWVDDRLRARGELLSKSIERRLADGRWVRLAGHRTADGGIVSIHTDITELKEREQELLASEARARRAELRLRAAIESVSDAFVLWDAEERLVLCNQRFRDLYPENAPLVAPGVSITALTDHFARSGQLGEAVAEPARWVAERMARFRAGDGRPREYWLSDGRWVRVRDFTTDEGGRVTIHSEITELKQRESELREREAQLRGIVENIPGVVFRRERQRDGWIVFPYHSPRVEERYGLTASEITRDPSRFISAIHAADRAAWLTAVEESAAKLAPFAMNLRLNDPSGEMRWVRSMARPRRLEDGTVVWDGVSLDVTELKDTEQALRESEERYRSLIEAAPIALLIHHGERISSANAKALELFGAGSLAELCGRPILSLVHPDDREMARARLRDLQAGGRFNPPRELRVVRLDGTPVDVEAAAVAITEQGEPAIQVVLVDVTERKRAQARVHYLAHHDALTGLPNRALLLDRLDRALIEAQREQHRVAVVMLDLDHFKDINDSFGHPVGDQLMCAVAERLRRTVRASDTLARFGGDEFVLVQGGLGQADGARTLAQKIVDTLAEPFLLDGHEVHTGGSVGIALYPEDGDAPDRLIKHADLALYRAKARGRNRIEFFVAAMNDRARAQKALESDLRAALEERQLTLAFRPRYELASRRLSGVQALIRWRHPEQGLIAPRRLLRVAEAGGLIRPLGRWLLEAACRQARAWQDADVRCPVSVDLLPIQCRQLDLIEQVDRSLAQSGLAPDLLELAVTEALLLEHSSAQTERLLRRLAARGIGLAVAGFGTGCSSLAQLEQLPIARIELDRTFIHRLGAYAVDEAVIRGVVALGRSLGRRTVADGIETEAQLRFLGTLGCDEGRGELLGAPMLASQVEHLLSHQTEAGSEGHREGQPPIALGA